MFNTPPGNGRDIKAGLSHASLLMSSPGTNFETELGLMKYSHQVHRNVTLSGTPTTMAGDKCTETKTENVENLNILVVDC